MNVVLLEPDRERGERICAALASQGFFLSLATDPLYVLTMAERAAFDYVFVSGNTKGMDAATLAEILVTDEAQQTVEVILFDTTERGPFPRRVRAVQCPTEGQLIGTIAANVSAARDMRSGQTSGAFQHLRNRGVAMIGTFEVTTLGDLIQLVCSTGDRGSIVLRTPEGYARIGFDAELVQSVDYLQHSGLDAMTLLVEDVDSHPATQFRVSKAYNVPEQPMRIRPSGLMLEVAVRLDDLRRGQQPIGGRS